jgi:hypothetical protein
LGKRGTPGGVPPTTLMGVPLFSNNEAISSRVISAAQSHSIIGTKLEQRFSRPGDGRISDVPIGSRCQGGRM